MNRSTVVLRLLLAITAGHLSEATEHSSVSPAARTVAITIDDVPLGGGRWSEDAVETVSRIKPGILEALVARSAPAIGFVTADRVQVAGQIDARMAIRRSWNRADTRWRP